ncbi:MAG TPA: hypothetical protein VFN10_22995 [Thermoanaerobaculia bacterium]|nr:hypothetical protein [Thermoanaerobaculia bacterium]
MRFKSCFALALLAVCTPLCAQDAWTFRTKFELRANYRQSDENRFQLKFGFPPEFLPHGETHGFEETPDAGSHVELSVANVQLDTGYGNWLAARAKVHFQDKYRRNPTPSDRKIDADELFIRIGPKPEFLERPERTSFFFQAGKFPKMERQPIRLLESYGLAATSFNRFEDVQLQVGGSVGRNLYWRLQAANGNPLFFRDPNALAGGNGQPALREPFPDPDIKSGFPILYNAETEDLFFSTKHVQYGEGLGYRWQNDAQTYGFDAIAFHYRRDLADQENLTGTFYGGDLDLIDEVLPGIPRPLPLNGRKKEEWGGRIYSEWHGGTAIVQYTKQSIAGLYREGWEGEAGYEFRGFGPITSIQPAVRLSGLTNRFTGNGAVYPSPSIWWQWTKVDGGVRIGLPKHLDLTVETTRHNLGRPAKLHLRETLVTLRWRV